MDPRKENTTAVTGVTLDQTELNLKVGQTATLTPTITPDNASNKNISSVQKVRLLNCNTNSREGYCCRRRDNGNRSHNRRW